MGRHLKIADFQTEIDGKGTDLFFLENRHGVRAAITNYGARVVALWLPDAAGEPDNIVAGYDTIEGYLDHDEAYLGAMVGRYANRIENASFELEGKRYHVTANEGRHHIHGGNKGFHNSVWEAEQPDTNSVKLGLELKDGEEGFPGNIKVEVTYSFSDSDELIIETGATTDRTTVLNVTNHSYFNLSGENGSATARSHRLQINADHFLPVTVDKIPEGSLKPVRNSPFDFRTFRAIGQHLDPTNEQLNIADGYDHNFVINNTTGQELTLAARVQEPVSGRGLELTTTEPGLQFFECVFPKEMELNLSSAFCLEPQHFPDSPNRSHFPSTVLKAGEQFYSKSTYRFRNDV